MFYRQETDGTRSPVSLENTFAGPAATPCWIIGGGPSLARLPIDAIHRSPAPRFAVNLSGAGLLRPTFWTSYDPTARFHRSIYLDASIMKFVHGCRAMDLAPQGNEKICDCPNLYFFDREQQRGFQEFPGSADSPVTDWQDSLIQAIDIAYRLGFRTLYLAGCEMRVAPSFELQQAAERRETKLRPDEPLIDFIKRCERAGLSRAEMEPLALGPQYHFDEEKSFAAAVQTDFHYYRVTQYLRLSRRSMALHGLRLISVTPESRLNAFFPYLDALEACEEIHAFAGIPEQEQTRGRYTTRSGANAQRDQTVMRDFRPHFWPPKERAKKTAPQTQQGAPSVERQRIVKAIKEIPIHLDEEGNPAADRA